MYLRASQLLCYIHIQCWRISSASLLQLEIVIALQAPLVVSLNNTISKRHNFHIIVHSDQTTTKIPEQTHRSAVGTTRFASFNLFIQTPSKTVFSIQDSTSTSTSTSTGINLHLLCLIGTTTEVRRHDDTSLHLSNAAFESFFFDAATIRPLHLFLSLPLLLR